MKSTFSTLRPSLRRTAIALPAFAAALSLAGCSAMLQDATSSPQAGVTLAGNFHGGQQPVSGVHVYLYAAGSGSYGAASSSLLSTSATGVSTDGNGNGYVTTTAAGNFTITGDFTCPTPSSQTYLLGLGGNPGLGGTVNNTAIALMAALGPCSGLTSATNIVVNEVSTAGAVTALQQFMTDATHVGSSTNNTAGLVNAFLSASNIVALNASNGARTTNILGTGSVPATKINTLGNILAPCVNSASNTSSACSGLFAAVTPPGGTAPSDTIGAMLMIAKNPTYNVGGIFSQITPAAPFSGLNSAPNDYTIGITYTGGGLTYPGIVVIDGVGDAYTASCPNCSGVSGTDAIVGFGPQGAILTGANGFTTNIHLTQGLAIDSTGDIWSVNVNNGTYPDQVVRMTPSGALTAGFPFSNSNINTPLGIAIDQNNFAWITNYGANSILRIGIGGYQASNPVGSPGFTQPKGIAIDQTGNIFVAGSGSNSILKTNSGGQVLSGPGAGFTGAGLAGPVGVALDANDQIFTIDNATNDLTVLSGIDGSPYTTPPGDNVGIQQASFISLDGFSTAWFANCRVHCPGNQTTPDAVMHVAITGAQLSGPTGIQEPHFSTVGTTAIDFSGNLWVSNNTGGSLTELLGVAGPVRTPILPLPGIGLRP